MIVLTLETPVGLDEQRRAAAEEDGRVYVVCAPNRPAAVRKEWEHEARGGESIWERALRERGEWTHTKGFTFDEEANEDYEELLRVTRYDVPECVCQAEEDVSYE
jgi:hypothetical protein